MNDVLNEVAARAYTIGRWPDSTAEITIATADKSQIDDSGGERDEVWMCYIDADAYDGAISFKVNGWGGYKIRPLTVDYAEGIQGWAGFVDMGLVSTSAGYDRKYKMPGGVTSATRVTALVKKKYDFLYDDDDEFPIRSFAAIKAGALAVNYENENEVQLAEKKWAEFEGLLLRDQKQFDGPKQIKVAFKPSYSQKPRSFR